MTARALKYAFVWITPAIVLFSLSRLSYWSFTALVFVFGVIPFLELFSSGSSRNLQQAEEEIAKHDKAYDYLLYSLVPLQYLILIYFLFQVSRENLPLLVTIGLITAYGMSCGILGINAAHELGHRSTKYEQFMSKMLLLSTLYLHFFIEHNRGHHKNVATDEDPASSRHGESVYAFYIRSICNSWLSAWKLERQRLQNNSLPFWSLHNEMLRFQLIQAAVLGIVVLTFGMATLVAFVAGATIGIILLETVNYIEHYGLRRKKKGNRYERTLPVHSWNSNHPLGRLLLLELSRHSDHHFIASRKYQVLRHHDDSPQMPTGYPGMMLLALVPFLWFRIMNKRIRQFRETVSQ
jgi:alkane 1-monooxygenase